MASEPSTCRGIVQILVNHLTRMQPGYVCAAGVDVNTMEHVRPVLRHGRLPTSLLKANGGPIDLGAVTDLGPVTDAGRAPELEDRCFDPARAMWLFDDDPNDFWDLLDGTSRESLAEIFGPALDLWDESGTVEAGSGDSSLGCLKPEGQPWLYVDYRGTIRLVLDHPVPSVDLAVNDLRLYERDQKTPRRDLVADVQRRLEGGVEAILSVGLTRPWRKRGDDAERHWLQVNNIHLRDAPLWGLQD